MRISDWSSDVCSSDLPDDLEFTHVRIDNLPLYNQDFDADYPAEPARLKKDVEAADAVLFVTPEYNRAMPGVLKNAIDIASRPWGTNSFAGKPAGVLGISVGAIGTALAQQHLRNTLARSEENTSELQSLMRTSYAVFCL